MRSLLKAAMAITRKELYLEWKTKRLVSTMLIFASLVIVTFSFAFDPVQNTVKALIPGLIWIIIVFAGILAFNRSFLDELRNDSLHGLIIAPIDPFSIFLGKMAANFIFLMTVQIVAIPLLFILFDFDFPFHHLFYFIFTLFLGTIGFSGIGTFLAALSANSHRSEMLLPVILFPVATPMIIAAVQSTKIILIDIEQWPSAVSWMQFIAVYDFIFLVLGFILFEYILEV